MDHSFLIHSSASGHLGCFHVLGIVNSAAVNIHQCLFILSLSLLVDTKFLVQHYAKKLTSLHCPSSDVDC